MSEEQVEAIFQHACEGAAESIGSTRVDWQRVVDAIRELRRERDEARRLLEASESLRSATISTMRRNEAELTDARLWLDSSESALQEAQRALFRWLPNRIGSEYDDLIAADAMALMGLESTEGLREVGGEILIELMQKRRLLDDARALVRDSCPFVPQWATVLQQRYASFLADAAAPVPAQPAAVPEAVAKDAAAILVQALEEIAWQRPLGVRPSKSGKAMERAAIIALHKYNALLSAADTEVKNNV